MFLGLDRIVYSPRTVITEKVNMKLCREPSDELCTAQLELEEWTGLG
jgi:hypothetical protein